VKRRAVILFNQVDADAPKDDVDVLAQVDSVGQALKTLGYAVTTIGFTLELGSIRDQLEKSRPDLVFNLTESVAGDGQLIYLAPALLDHLRIPYSGCPKEAMFITSHKPIAKWMMQAAGIPTPEWIEASRHSTERFDPPRRYLVKSVWEHASNWFSDDSLLEVVDAATAVDRLRQRRSLSGREFFAERYIDGREFNLSLLAGETLAVPEIRFEGYAAGKLKVVDYRAKWEEDSFEFSHTRRHFDFPASDQPLLEELRRVARHCWDLFSLRGYARVDFRVDAQNRPWVLEVNANPCISPDSGFVAAAERSGFDYVHLVERIIADIPGAAEGGVAQ